MRPQKIIARKRDGHELSVPEIKQFINGVCDGSWADYQTSALIMAMVIRGLTLAEQDAMTDAMLHSGEVLNFSDIQKPKADKHSTGGVGDKCSLVIAPIAAACGVAVPMISGRGLGHTGGTLDKLESIPGYNVNLSKNEFHRVIDECGFAMAGQTAEIVPADKKIYALRDATATVPCIPLIVASIMSKKLAEGLDALVLDVKTGSGAFMPDLEDSLELARSLVQTGKNFGVKTEAVLSDMGQPLGKYVGNAHEVHECIEILQGKTAPEAEPTRRLSVELSARMLVLAGIEPNIVSARDKAEQKLASGEAFEKFRENVELQGGDPRVCDDPDLLLDTGLETIEIKTESEGFVQSVDTFAVGTSVVTIGGGRTKAEDSVDPCVGFASLVKIGDQMPAGELIGILYCRRDERADAAAQKLRSAYSIGPEPAEPPVLLRDVIA